MAPEKTDPDGENANSNANDSISSPTENAPETPANLSTLSVDSTVSETDHDPYFEPVVSLPVVEVKTNEEDEEELLKLRCKLFRYHLEDGAPAWKERGTGDVKMLKRTEIKTLSLHHSMFKEYEEEGNEITREGDYYHMPVQEIKVRLLMRQDKTLKVRANHYITSFMELKPNCGSDRAWVWSAPIDFADEQPKKELFAIKFVNSENAQLFKKVFDESRLLVSQGPAQGEKAEDKTKPKPASTPDTDSQAEKEKTEKSDNKDDSTKEADKTTEEVEKNLASLSVGEKSPDKTEK